MRDEELRSQFGQWARPLQATAPPPLAAISRRARRRTARIAASSLAAVLILAGGAIQATYVLGAGTSPGPAISSSPGPSSTKTAPGALYAAAPYYIVGVPNAGAEVRDAVTGKKIATIPAPVEGARGARYSTFFGAIAAAGDDRTFVLAAIANTDSPKATPVWLFELHLAADGVPGRLKPLKFLHREQGVVGSWFQNLSSMAMTANGSELAIATNRSDGNRSGGADIQVIALATGKSSFYHWRQGISSLSWAGDRTISFACGGVCVLRVPRAGQRGMSHGQLLIPWKTSYRGMQTEQWPVITPDGSAIYAAMDGGGLGLVEFSARTGKPIRLVLGPRPTNGDFCGVLWSNASGSHMFATCPWDTASNVPAATGSVIDGRFSFGSNLPPVNIEDNGSGAGGLVIGW